jgi:hypothetical protein
MGCWSAALGGRRDDTPEDFNTMSVRLTKKNLKLTGAAGAALALAATIAGPALAAGEFTGTTTYNCTVAAPTVTFAMNTPPAKMAAGQTVKVPDASDFTLDAGTTTLAGTALGWSKVGGSVASTPSNAHSGLSLTLPKTDLNNNGDGTTTSHATGNALLRSTKVGTYTVNFASFDAVLQGYNADGTKHGDPFILSDNPNTTPPPAGPACTNLDPSGATTPMSAAPAPATVKVVKDKTTTTVKASFAKAKHQISSVSKVKSKYGIKATGKVKVSLKKGTKTLKTIKVKLNKKGIAKAAFKVTKAGKYTVKTVYGGSSNLKGSHGAKNVTV